MTRAALLALCVLLAACSTEAPQSCPGEQVGNFAFAGNISVGALAAGLDPDPTLTNCPAALAFPTSISFGGTLAADSTGSAGVLCRANGPVLFGTRSGTRWKVEDATDGAVLAACDPTCAAHSHVFIWGDVVPDAISPTGFQGALIEQLTQTAGSCGACADASGVLSCAARYQLTGTVVTP